MFLPKAKTENIVVQETGDEVLIYDLVTNKAVCLNGTSAFIWWLCDGRHTLKNIAEAVNRHYGQPVNEAFVWLALEQLKRENLIDGNVPVPASFDGLSRRQMIRKVGLATMVALPFITSIMAPQSIQAQSGGVGLLGACPMFMGCAPGLTCKTCYNGTCPSGGALRCCQNPAAAGYGAQSPALGATTTCFPAANCASNAAQFCCTGMATFTVTNCSGMSGAGTCLCTST